MSETLKFNGYGIVLQEIPDEVSLAFNISNCPYRCPDCHSKYLWEDAGQPLVECFEVIRSYKNYISCVLFMGGDFNPFELSVIVKTIRKFYPSFKVALYSGSDNINLELAQLFDYYKIGRYDAKFGGLKNEATNQRLYKKVNNILIDITKEFKRKLE